MSFLIRAFELIIISFMNDFVCMHIKFSKKKNIFMNIIKWLLKKQNKALGCDIIY